MELRIASEATMNLLGHLDLNRVGAALLAAGPLLLQFGGSKISWWLGLGMVVAGPVLMGVRRER